MGISLSENQTMKHFVAIAVLMMSVVGCSGATDTVVGPPPVDVVVQFGSYMMQTWDGKAPPLLVDSSSAGGLYILENDLDLNANHIYSVYTVYALRLTCCADFRSSYEEDGTYAVSGGTITFTSRWSTNGIPAPYSGSITTDPKISYTIRGGSQVFLLR
jgi:hypothetical protein